MQFSGLFYNVEYNFFSMVDCDAAHIRHLYKLYFWLGISKWYPRRSYKSHQNPFKITVVTIDRIRDIERNVYWKGYITLSHDDNSKQSLELEIEKSRGNWKQDERKLQQTSISIGRNTIERCLTADIIISVWILLSSWESWV